MIAIDVRGMPEVQALLRNLAEEQLPFAISSALNSTAFAVQKHQKARMPTVFDRPTPLIKGAFRVEKATKQSLTAIVYVDPKRAAVLKVHEEGGKRGDQKIERYFKRKGWLPNGWRAVPTDKMPRNSYGNPRQADVTKIIAALPNAGGQRGDVRRHFVIQPGGRSRLSPGVYRTLSRSSGSAMMKLYHFVATAQYRKRLEFAKTSEAEARRLLPGLMEKAIQRAIATAR